MTLHGDGRNGCGSVLEGRRKRDAFFMCAVHFPISAEPPSCGNLRVPLGVNARGVPG